MARTITVASKRFRHTCQPAARRVPLRANGFEGKALALGGLPVDASKADELRGGARRGAEQIGELLKAGGGVTCAGHAEIIVVGLVDALAQLRAQLHNLRAGGLVGGEEIRCIFHCGQAGVVAVVAVERGEPEELVALELAAHANAPGEFVVRRRVGQRGKAGRGGGACVLNPLRKWILRAPVVLPVEEEALAVQFVAAAFGLHAHAAAGGVGAFRFDIAGFGFYFADGELADGKSAAARPAFVRATLGGADLVIGGCALSGGLGAGGCAEGHAGADAVDGGVDWVLASAAKGGLRRAGS